MQYEKIHKRKSTPHKPYWNTTLSKLWHTVRDANKLVSRLIKAKAQVGQIQCAKKMVKDSLKNFDKEHRKIKRKYQKGNSLKIDEMIVNDPRKFWDKIKQLGPRKTDIPWRIDGEGGESITDKEEIKEIWANAFENLYKNDGNYDDKFLKQKLRERDRLVQHRDATNHVLNKPITLHEVTQTINKSKNMKAVGIDNITNELIKNDTVKRLLYELFSKLFETGQTLSLWRNSVIHPIPKGKNKMVQPLLYRGLALQSCVYKIYSCLLNDRHIKFLEGEEMISEVQNGFRKGRSCQQHLFVVNELTQLRLEAKRSTYLCFVDFRKAF